MNEPKLRLVHSSNSATRDDSLVGQDEEIARMLALAAHPTELDAALNEQLIARALEDPLAAATSSELRAAEQLRELLDGASGPSEHRATVEELRAAWRPIALDSARNQALVERHTARAPRLRRLVVPVFAMVAAAAGVLLALGQSELRSLDQARAPKAELIVARSTAELFDPGEAFPRTGGESARIDRIATARAADLRANRFASWGAR